MYVSFIWWMNVLSCGSSGEDPEGRSGEVRLAVMFTVFGTDVSAALLFSGLPLVWSGPVLLVVAAMHQNRVFLGWRFFHQQSLENAFVWALLLEIILIHLQLRKQTRLYHLEHMRFFFENAFDTIEVASWYLFCFCITDYNDTEINLQIMIKTMCSVCRSIETDHVR